MIVPDPSVGANVFTESLKPLFYLMIGLGIFAVIARFSIEAFFEYLNEKRQMRFLGRGNILERLRSMSPREFEEFIARLFRSKGFEVELTGGSGDGGIDLEMRKNGRYYAVQCKKFITRKVTPHDVRDFYGAISSKNITGVGFFVTTNIFTQQAVDFAEGKPMELIDGTKLVEYVRESGILGLQQDQGSRHAVESGKASKCPSCGGDLVIRQNRKDGQNFWGCSQYPKCHFTKPI